MLGRLTVIDSSRNSVGAEFYNNKKEPDCSGSFSFLG